MGQRRRLPSTIPAGDILRKRIQAARPARSAALATSWPGLRARRLLPRRRRRALLPPSSGDGVLSPTCGGAGEPLQSGSDSVAPPLTDGSRWSVVQGKFPRL